MKFSCHLKFSPFLMSPVMALFLLCMCVWVWYSTSCLSLIGRTHRLPPHQMAVYLNPSPPELSPDSSRFRCNITIGFLTFLFSSVLPSVCLSTYSVVLSMLKVHLSLSLLACVLLQPPLLRLHCGLQTERLTFTLLT